MKRWPLYQPRGGFLVPERCTVAYANAAQAMGAEIHGREEVLAWEPRGDGVRVITTRDEYEADRLVFTAGSWNRNLLPILNGLATPERQVLAWIQPERPEIFTPAQFPVFNLLVDEGRYYGFPIYGVPGFKFGKYHHFEEQGPADLLDPEPTYDDELMLREFCGTLFSRGHRPNHDAQRLHVHQLTRWSILSSICTRTIRRYLTPPASPGHGYKFASVIGEILADLAERGESRHEISFFGLQRLTGQVSPLYADRYRQIGTAQRTMLQSAGRHRLSMNRMPRHRRSMGQYPTRQSGNRIPQTGQNSSRHNLFRKSPSAAVITAHPQQ